MKTKKFKLRYIFIIWIIVYLLISVFKYFQINSLISKKYGALSKTFNTKMYTNESVVIDGLLLIIGVPITFVTGGAEFTQWLYGDIKLDFKRKLITKIELKSDIMDKTFNITMQGGRIVNDNFYEVISNDQKFTHLYSEWVKKQVGIEDSNVEFGFAGNFDNPYIEFDKITSLSDDYREIFENTHNLYVWQCRVVNIKDLNENNKVEIAKMVREKYLSKAMSITGITKDLSKNYRGHIKLSNSNFDSDNNLKYELSYNAKDEKANLQEYIVGVGWVSYE